MQMFKKIMMILACTFVALSVMAAPKIQVRQNTKEAMVETYFSSIINDDVDAMWLVIDPALRTTIIKEMGSEAKGKQEFWKGFNASFNANQKKQLRDLMNDPEYKKILLKNMIDSNGQMLIKKGNKWYFNPLKTK